MTSFAWIVAVVALSTIAVAWYGRWAVAHDIVAVPGARTLHERVVPRGAGIAFAAVFVAAALALGIAGRISPSLTLAFGAGGALAAILGFVDDIYDIPAAPKLLLQLGLAGWLVASMYGTLLEPAVRSFSAVPGLLLLALALFVPVWQVNMFNFIDGADGMAITAAVLTSAALVSTLLLSGSDRVLVPIVAIFGAAALGFLPANVPPARMFMGDSGSLFLGYCVAALMLATVASGQLRWWTWVALLGYYVADTTTTTIIRVFLVKRKFYQGHRSHAYQNLARVSGSHTRVTGGVVLYQLLWALPLAIWSVMVPRFAPWAAIFATVPAVLWAIRFGPLYSRH